MTPVALGKDTMFWVEGLELSSQFTDVSVVQECGAPESTGMGGSDWRSFATSPSGWNASISGYWRRRVAGGALRESADVIMGALAQDPAGPLIVAQHKGALGEPAFIGERFTVNQAAVDVPIDELMTISGDFTGDGEAAEGWVLAPAAAVGAAGSVSLGSVDLGAYSLPAWVAARSYVYGALVSAGGSYYRCRIPHTSATGNVANGAPNQGNQRNWESYTPRIIFALQGFAIPSNTSAQLQHSANNTSWSNVGAALALTAAGGAYRAMTVAAPGRYWRVTVTKTANNRPVIACAVARL